MSEIKQSLPIWLTESCQFGQHGEPFLWNGSGDDDINIAIIDLLNLATDNPKLAHEAAEFIAACKADAANPLTRRGGGCRMN